MVREAPPELLLPIAALAWIAWAVVVLAERRVRRMLGRHR